MKILIIEDDYDISKQIRSILISDDNTVEIAADGVNGSFLARSFDYDAIVLNHHLPKKDGLTICKDIRSAGKSTPILFLTIASDMETKLEAFKRGVDDYLIKPFSIQELYARLKAIHRRPYIINKDILKICDIELDTDKHYFTRNKKHIHLTHKEYSLLEYFMKNIGTVTSRAILMENIWTADSNPFSNTIEMHITNLRKKINCGNRPNLIGNVTGRGYVMDKPENLRKL